MINVTRQARCDVVRDAARLLQYSSPCRMRATADLKLRACEDAIVRRYSTDSTDRFTDPQTLYPADGDGAPLRCHLSATATSETTSSVSSRAHVG